MKCSVRNVSVLLIGCLLVLQACDLLFTWRLLSGARPDVYEANPLAAALLQHFGWTSLAVLKCGTSTLIVGAILLLARHRPATAHRLLGGLCLVMASVVGYSAWLLFRPLDPMVAELPHLNAQDAQLDRQLGGVARFGRKRSVLCTDILNGRIGLAAGIQRMGTIVREEHANLTARIRAYLPALDRPEEVAAFLYYHSSLLVAQGDARASQLEDLSRKMRRDYPRAPQVNYQGSARALDFPWGQGRHVSADLETSNNAS
jgi:hypothetical protein